MIAFLIVLAVLARDDFSHLHRYTEGYLESQDNMKFKSLSVKHTFPFTFEYAKLNDDAVIARNKETNEIIVFTTSQNEPWSFSSLQEYDMKLIRDLTSRCMPLYEYEFAGDFDKRAGGEFTNGFGRSVSYKPTASSYMVAMNSESKQTFGDSINILHFQDHQSYIRWCEKNPAKYQREREQYSMKNSHINWNEHDFEFTFERYIVSEYFGELRLYRQKRDVWHEPEECILKFSKISQYPEDLLQKSMYNGFQDQHFSVELKNIEAMLIKNGYKYPENFSHSQFSKIVPYPDGLKDCRYPY